MLQTTHWLACKHVIGKNVHNYQMPCNVLGKTKSGKLKVEVFGDRFWYGKEHIRKIRYVSPSRVTKGE